MSSVWFKLTRYFCECLPLLTVPANIISSNVKININISPERQIVDSYGSSKLVIPEKNILLTASEIHLDAEGNLRAQGNVNINTDNTNCFAEKLCVRTENKTQIATLTGNPYILRDNDKIYADEIIYNFNTEELTIKGNVHS